MARSDYLYYYSDFEGYDDLVVVERKEDQVKNQDMGNYDADGQTRFLEQVADMEGV